MRHVRLQVLGAMMLTIAAIVAFTMSVKATDAPVGPAEAGYSFSQQHTAR